MTCFYDKKNLNERGVYLRLNCLSHWGISEERNTQIPPGTPVLLDWPHATSDHDDLSSFITQDHLMSDLLSNIPPEHIRRRSGVHDLAASDVYTLAATIYEAFTSHHCLSVPQHHDHSEYKLNTALLDRVHTALIWEPIPPSHHRAELPQILDTILLKALNKDPNSRYVNSRGLAHDIEKLQALVSGIHHGEALFMHVGVGDQLYHIEATRRLYGRARVEEVLKNSFSSASHGQSSSVTVEGQSGSGKTAVITRTLLPCITEENGLWVSAKAQVQAQHTFSIMTEMINAFLRPLLLTPDLNATTCKTLVEEALGHGPMLIMAAEVDQDLRAPFGFPEPLAGDEAESNPLQRIACQAATIRLIRRVAQELRPVVVFIDDCQWLPEADVGFLTSLLEDLHHATLPLLMVCAYRPKDPNDAAQHAFHESALPLLSSNERLHVGPLSDEASFIMIADALGPPREDHEELNEERRLHTFAVQDFIRQSSSLVPMFIRQMLVTMRDRRILTFDWGAEAWTFDAAQAMQVGSAWKSDDSAQFLRGGVLDQLPRDVQNILVAASTLSGAGPFSADLLAIVLDRPAMELVTHMSFLVQRQVFSEVQLAEGALESNAETFNVHGLPHIFSHDQWIEASYTLCPVNYRAYMHYTQAVRLDEHATGGWEVMTAMNLLQAHELGEPASVDQALRFNRSLGHTFLPHEQANYRQVLISAARQELSLQKCEACRAYLTLASDFQHGHHSAELCRVLYDCFILENALDKALQVADTMFDHAETKEDSLESAALQLRCLYQLDPARAQVKLCEVTRNYAGIDLEADGSIMESRDVFRGDSHSPHVPEVTPATVHATMESILSEAVPVAWSISQGLGVAAVWHCIQIAQVCPSHRSLPTTQG
jgi:hypothetical protein